MNGIDSILKKINEQGDAACSAILSEARGTADFGVAEAVNTAEQEAAALLKKASSAADIEYKRIVSGGHSEARKLLLSKKQELIDRAFSEALHKLQSLSGDELKSILIKMISAAVQREDSIVLPEQYQSISGGIEEALKKSISFSGNLTFSSQIQSGFILKRGGIEINKTFGALIRQHREELEPDVVAALFTA